MPMFTGTRIMGIDFSGAIDAGRKIWIADGDLHGDQLTIRRCRSAAQLRASSVFREPATAALLRTIRRAHGAVIGCDFPFGLARSLVRHTRWEDFAAHFARDFPTPQDLRSFADVMATDVYARGGRVSRATDRQAQTPFAPHNLRIFRQTYYGIRDLLAPLAAQGTAVLPFTAYTPGETALMEICPASLLKSAGLYLPYKGRGEAERAQRAAIIAYFSDPARGLHLAPLSRTVRARVVGDREGDAIDSVLAAYSAALALTAGEVWHTPTADEAVEARVYGWRVPEPA
jgi:hypothetical protein